MPLGVCVTRRVFPNSFENVHGLIKLQIFSGKYPFEDIENHFQFMRAVQQGKRPTKPSQDLCQAHGLNDNMWHLISSFWVQNPSNRPPAKDIVQQLRALANPDPRSAEDNNASSQSNLVATHPYSYPPRVILPIYRSQDSLNVLNSSELLHREYDKPFSTWVATDRMKGVDANIGN